MKTYLVPMFALVESPDDRTVESIDDTVAAARDEMTPHAWHAIDGARVALLFDETLGTVALPDDEAEAHSVVDSHPALRQLVRAAAAATEDFPDVDGPGADTMDRLCAALDAISRRAPQPGPSALPVHAARMADALSTVRTMITDPGAIDGPTDAAAIVDAIDAALGPYVDATQG